MLKQFSITNDAAVDFGVLSYDSADKSWRIKLNPERSWDDTPLSLAIYLKQGKLLLDEQESLAWVRDRLVPPNRQNINQILQVAGLEEYDEFALIQLTEGHSPNDNLFIVEQPH
jgi:uncharacterized protein (DUF1684 family)